MDHKLVEWTPPLAWVMGRQQQDTLPHPLVTPLPNQEQINHPFSNHTFTMSMPTHIHHHYVPFVTHTHTSFLQLHRHTHYVITPAQTLPEWWYCWPDGWRNIHHHYVPSAQQKHTQHQNYLTTPKSTKNHVIVPHLRTDPEVWKLLAEWKRETVHQKAIKWRLGCWRAGLTKHGNIYVICMLNRLCSVIFRF